MRPIDADELKRRILDSCFCADWVRVLVNRVIDDCPTVDAEPVTHAHWDKSYCIGENNDKLQDGYKCSHCGHYVPDTSFGFYYCDNCGAKMDGDTND